MTMIDSTVTPQACPPPPLDAEKVTQAAAAATPAALPDAVTEQLNRLRSIEHLGYLLQAKDREVAKAETATAEATAARKSAMEFENKKRRERQEIVDEMSKLAIGKSTERLFPPQGDAPAAASDAKPDDAWKSVDLATLTPKLSPGKLKVLREHEPSIRTMGDLTAWQEMKGQFWGKDIKGLGEKGQEQLALACETYFAAHPQKASEPAVTAGEPFDDMEPLLDTRETIIESPGLYHIEIIQRRGGRWAFACFGVVGKKTLAMSNFSGSYSDRVNAIAEASEKLFDFADGLIKAPKTPKKQREQAKEIAAAIDRLDKKLAADAKK